MNNRKWNFHNTFSKLPKLFFTKQNPVPVRSPKLVIFNTSLADSLGIPFEPEVFAGNAIPKGAEPIALGYAGHQFGHFTMLGDGRAILLGEQITNSGKRYDIRSSFVDSQEQNCDGEQRLQTVDIQLKGSGRTPYSRSGDGRAALGPMLREYIISEAMYALGIPTTRSLAVMETGETVMREKALKGAILTRIAASHIRVGTFEYASRFGTIDDVRRLANYTIERHFSNFISAKNKYLLMLREVIRRQASLVSKWQLVGFVHGVMNTDNMAVSGETIDYGPCAFMDVYHPATVFSSIDTNGRYSYENQPEMTAWNLARFAETLLPLLHYNEDTSIKLAQKELDSFWEIYKTNWLVGMRAKLGLFDEKPEDALLVTDLLQVIQKYEADYTNTFCSLTLCKADDTTVFFTPEFYDWNNRWQTRLSKQKKTKDEIRVLMKSHNPAIIPRNSLVENAINAAVDGDLDVMHKLLSALSNPFMYTPIQEKYSTSHIPSVSCGYQTFCGT